MNNFNWKKILLKISGESLMGDDPFGINSIVVKSFANQIHEVVKLGYQLGVEKLSPMKNHGKNKGNKHYREIPVMLKPNPSF